MENYILQILESSTRVIVPEFGAFIVKQRNPLTVVFNEFLQYNDGVMVDVIAKNEDISRDDAKKKIDDYVSQITDALDNGKSFPVGKLGVIVKGGLGKISLEKEDPTGTTPAKAVKKAPAARKKAASITEDVNKATNIAEIEPSINKPATKTAEVKTEPQHNGSETKTEVVTKKPETETAVTHKPEAGSSGNTTDLKKSSESEIPVTQHVVADKKEEPGKELEIADADTAQEIYTSSRYKRSNVIVWVIIILAINILIVGYFVYSDELKGIFTQKTADTLLAQPPVTDEIAPVAVPEEEPAMTEESVGSEEIMPVEQPAQEVNESTEGTRYYIVAGVFRDENNADKLVKELHQKGFQAEKFGHIGNLHAVSYAVYTTKQEADRNLARIQKESDPEAWIRRVD